MSSWPTFRQKIQLMRVSILVFALTVVHINAIPREIYLMLRSRTHLSARQGTHARNDARNIFRATPIRARLQQNYVNLLLADLVLLLCSHISAHHRVHLQLDPVLHAVDFRIVNSRLSFS